MPKKANAAVKAMSSAGVSNASVIPQGPKPMNALAGAKRRARGNEDIDSSTEDNTSEASFSDVAIDPGLTDDEDEDELDNSSDQLSTESEFSELGSEHDEPDEVPSDEYPSDEYEEGSSSDDVDEEERLSDEEHHEDGFGATERKPEIEAGYASDSSTESMTNTIGDRALLAKYNEMPHIGYDIDGRRIMRPATQGAIDALLGELDRDGAYTGVMDPETGELAKLTSEQIETLKRVSKNMIPDEATDPYPEYVDWFTSKLQVTPISQKGHEPKSRFVPSKHEQKKIMQLAKAIKDGRITPNKPKEDENKILMSYDIWAGQEQRLEDHVMHMPAPKMKLPGHEESYNPPEEYLPSNEEQAAYDNADDEDRKRMFLSKKYRALRLVPGWEKFVNERFDRCLDLYLAPRVRYSKLNIDPESLIPKLPSPRELRPFPSKCALVYRGHQGGIRTCSVFRSQFLATGGDDGSLKVWDIISGRLLWSGFVGDKIDCIVWNPDSRYAFIAVASGTSIYLMQPPLFSESVFAAAKDFATQGFAREQTASDQPQRFKWTKPSKIQSEQGILLQIQTPSSTKRLSWHKRGEYLVSTSQSSEATSVLIHHLPKHKTQMPFRKAYGQVQAAKFHPVKPWLLVATQRFVRIFDLSQGELVRTLQTGMRWISSLSVHPRGDHVLVGSYDRRVAWFDLDMGDKPFKTMRFHGKAVRDVEFHPDLPLFVSASDDGSLQVFHGRTFTDLMMSPLIVPLKILKGHSPSNGLGVLASAWLGGRNAWVISAGADGEARLWT